MPHHLPVVLASRLAARTPASRFGVLAELIGPIPIADKWRFDATAHWYIEPTGDRQKRTRVPDAQITIGFASFGKRHRQ